MALGRPAGSSSLDAAGITDPVLRADLLACRALHAQHGRTYFLATALLPPAKRPWVWALYGFARYADDFVDSLTTPDPEALVAFSRSFTGALSTGEAEGPVGRAMLATVERWSIPLDVVDAFLASMLSDITQTSYPDYAALERYMYGSASVIGLQMLPVLGTVAGLEEAAVPRARLLGEAFQMANFVRDVGEDLDRGRTYLPDDAQAAAGVSRAELFESRRTGETTPGIRALLADQVALTRSLFARARPGIAMLDPTSRDSIDCAFRLYGGILDEVQGADYQVMRRRVAVPPGRRLAVAVPGLVRARRARRDAAAWQHA